MPNSENCSKMNDNFQICVSLKLESDPTVCINSTYIHCSACPIWAPANLFLDGYSMPNQLIFEFTIRFSQGTLVISRLIVPTGRLEYTGGIGDLSNVLTIDNVSMTYIAKKYIEDSVQLGQIRISVISIRDHGIENILRPASGTRFAIQCGWVVERAQRFEISPNGQKLLRWICGDNHPTTFSMPPIQLADGIDSVDYSNPVHMLPRNVAKKQAFALFNYQYTPPTVIPFVLIFQPVETVEKSFSLLPKWRRRQMLQIFNVEKELGEGLQVKMYYLLGRGSVVRLIMMELYWN